MEDRVVEWTQQLVTHTMRTTLQVPLLLLLLRANVGSEPPARSLRLQGCVDMSGDAQVRCLDLLLLQ